LSRLINFIGKEQRQLCLYSDENYGGAEASVPLLVSYHNVFGQASLDNQQNGVKELFKSDGAISILLQLLDYVQPDLHIRPNRRTASSIVTELFLEDEAHVVHLEFAFSSQVN